MNGAGKPTKGLPTMTKFRYILTTAAVLCIAAFPAAALSAGPSGLPPTAAPQAQQAAPSPNANPNASAPHSGQPASHSNSGKPARPHPAKPGQSGSGSAGSHGSTQGNSPSDPDGMENGGADKPGGTGGVAPDKDGNNGSGNDSDCEDDNNGKGVPGHCKDRPDNPNSNANGGDKVWVCHATGSDTNPFVVIHIALAGWVNGHSAHEGDVLLASGEGVCPGGTQAPGTSTDDVDKVWICHATGSEANPYVILNIALEGWVNGHSSHAGDQLLATAASACADGTTPPVSGETGGPEGPVGPGGVLTPPLGGDVSGNDTGAPQAQSGDEASGDSDNALQSDNVSLPLVGELPFTGMELGGLALLALALAAAGGLLWMRRRPGSVE
jgi:hypothetical protein